MAVRNRIFPLMEVEDGARWRFTVEHPPHEPVLPYIRMQGRFAHLTDKQVAGIRWELLSRRVANGI
jgi:hypothetical protein